MKKVVGCVLGVAGLVLAGWVAPLTAQQATPSADPVTTAVVMVQADEEADRASIRDLFARSEIQRAAKIGGIDLEQAQARLSTLEGDRLQRAAAQARALDSKLASQQGEIRISMVTLIIILLLVIIIIVLA